jgi:hypothetical protein
LPEVRHSILGPQQLPESGDNGGSRLADRRQRLMVFPAPAQRLEEIDEVVGRRLLRDDVLPFGLQESRFIKGLSHGGTLKLLSVFCSFPHYGVPPIREEYGRH